MRSSFHRFLIGNNKNHLLNKLVGESPLDLEQEWHEEGLTTDEDVASSFSSSKSLPENSEDDFSLLDFPIEILARILSFVDKETLFSKCSVVCSRLYRLLKSRSFWAAELERKYSVKELAWITSISPIDYGRLVVCQPFRRNLIKNCCGELKSLKYWTLTKPSDRQLIAVEINKSTTMAPGIGMRMTIAELSAVPRPPWLDIPGNHCCFAVSFAIFDMEQIVDFFLIGCQIEILDILRPPIAVGEWMANGFDSELTHRLEVSLLDGNGVELVKHVAENRLENNGGMWKAVHHVFADYPPGVRRLLFRHAAIDPLLNLEHFGAKFAGATVKILFPPNISRR